MGLGHRIALLAILFGVELTLASLYFDGASLASRGGPLTELLRNWAATALRFGIGLAAILATFAYLRRKAELDTLSARVSGTPVRFWSLGLHAVALALFTALGLALYSEAPIRAAADLVTAGFLAAALAMIVFSALAILPLALWLELARILGRLWAYSTAAALLAALATTATPALPRPASELTFRMVQVILRPFLSEMIVDPQRLKIATKRFSVFISPECSGLEGIALLLLFGALWLWLFRKECRFPQAFALLPAAIVVLFLLNSVRIAALVMIGHAGARQVAAQGFHSQAGWISFNAVAFGFCVAARRIRWVSVRSPQESEAVVNPVAPYLMPFLAILAAGMISRAMTGGFEWSYSLRLLAAGAALWLYRRDYVKADWRVGWSGPSAGVLVFAIWVGLERVLFPGAGAPMPAALSSATDPVRALWIGARVLSAVVAVPIAEEVAFRGFLIRRMITRDFDSLPMRSFTWFGLACSSIIFGVLHGQRWLAGTLAGILYGLVLIRRGRLGAAVLAHATTNALLAADVLLFGAWQLW